MSPFLELVAKDLLGKFEQNLNECTVVFPNRRSILYFNKYLSQAVKGNPIWAPHCITISDFIQSFSELEKADDLLLIFELYDVYSKVRKTTESFDNFYFWGELMLSDFNDIDKYLVNAEDLFKNLSALKNINEQFSYLSDNQIDAIKQFWTHFDVSKESTQREQFSNLWSNMFAIYKGFQDTLKAKGMAYEGFIYREVANIISNNKFDENLVNKIAFVGFNALNECEKSIFTKFKNNQKALFYWDYDKEYLNETHEAGFFVRNNLHNFPSALDKNIFNELQESKEINVIDIPSFTGQARQVSSLITNLLEDDAKMEKTAVLLSDENLLIPVLQSVPQVVQAINITMGYPVINTPLVALIESVLKLHSSAKVSANGLKHTYYYKQVLEIIGHPYIERYKPRRHNSLSREIAKFNRIYISPSRFENDKFLWEIFRPVTSGIDLLDRLSAMVKLLGSELFQNNSIDDKGFQQVDSEVFVVAFKSINRLLDLLIKSEIKPELPLCNRLLMKVLNGIKIPFEGEPLQGLQIMGFLESRALDFENLIILSVNEGNLPKTNIPISFIPHNLRHGFGLQTLEHRDAMYAYYFYRVLQRSSKVFLVYDSRSANVGNSEVSRYVTQLRYSGKYNIRNYSQSFSITTAKHTPIIVKKSKDIIEKLSKYTSNDSEKYLSPSALCNYIDCSLRFYFKYIEGIKEPELPAEEIDARILGNILHTAICELYTPILNQINAEELVKRLLSDKNRIEEVVKNAMISQYFKDEKVEDEEILSGRNYILFKILNRYIKEILEVDSHIENLTLKALEQNVVIKIPIVLGDEKFDVRVGGNIDRVDEVNGNLRIIDYKTGSVESKFKGLTELFQPGDKKLKKEIFQSILYSYIYITTNNFKNIISPGLYAVRKLFTSDFDPYFYIDNQRFEYSQTFGVEFEMQLKSLLAELYNLSEDFTQTSDIEKCKYCDYKTICNRT